MSIRTKPIHLVRPLQLTELAELVLRAVVVVIVVIIDEGERSRGNNRTRFINTHPIQREFVLRVDSRYVKSPPSPRRLP
jgi:hypothetical protein